MYKRTNYLIPSVKRERKGIFCGGLESNIDSCMKKQRQEEKNSGPQERARKEINGRP